MLFFYFTLALLGLAIGSFLGALSYRLPRGITLSGRSFCDHCRKKINWLENLPVVSYLVLGGKCKRCRKTIPLRYPLFELSTAALFVLTFYFWNSLTADNGIAYTFKENLGTISLIAYFLLLVAFIPLFAIDLEFKILPDQLLYIAGLVTALALLALPSPLLFEHLLWGMLSFIFFLLLYLATRGRGMGFGDVKLSFLLGALLGYPESLVWIFLSFLTGAVVGVILILAGKAKFGQAIPFGPFLLLGAITAFAYGKYLFNLFLSTTW